jgi:S1-C subfamily serine protease
MKQIFVGSVIRAKLYSQIKKAVTVPHILQAVIILLLIIVPLALRDKIFHIAEGDYSNVVYVETLSGTGSAVYVGGDGYLLTAAHVVADMSIGEVCGVQFYDPDSSPARSSMFFPAELVAMGNYLPSENFEEDYALLKLLYVDGSDFAKPCELGDSKNVKVNDPIKAEGYSTGAYSSNDGTINNINGGFLNSPKLLLVDANAKKGSSGGAIKTSNGKLLGIIILGGNDVEYTVGQTFVLKIDDIRTKLKSYGSPF